MPMKKMLQFPIIHHIKYNLDKSVAFWLLGFHESIQEYERLPFILRALATLVLQCCH